MRILYIGDDFVHSTSAHRAGALRRLGHDIVHLNPRRHIPPHRIISGINVRTGFRLMALWVGTKLRQAVEKALRERPFDVAWFDGCPEIPVSFYRWLRSQNIRIINYNVDDPFGTRDRRKWDLYKAAVPFHDLTVVLREQNVSEAKQYGARNVVRVYFSYDPVAHAAQPLSDDDRARFTTEVAFVGTWMPERGPFMKRLIKLGVPLSIWGDRWQKAPEWPVIQKVWRGPGIYGSDYVQSIQCAKVALGLLSKGNRDLHTTRSLEVPFIGGAVFCAERTVEHRHMLKEDEEAVFWSSPEECATQTQLLLFDESLRRRIAVSAQRRITADFYSNDATIECILTKLLC